MMVQLLTALAILWLIFRYDRWWLFVASGALILCGLVTVLEILDPALSLYAAVSAQLGLWALVYLSLLAGGGTMAGGRMSGRAHRRVVAPPARLHVLNI